MKSILQKFVFLIALSLALSPVMAKDETDSSKKPKAKTTETKKAAKDKKPAKKPAEKKTAKKSDDKKTTEKTTAKKADGKASDKKTTKASKPVKSKLTKTDKAKKFKDITVNINMADADTLAYYLVGIGEKRANAIIKQRKTAKFKDIEELKKVEGIGEAIFDGLRKNVSISKGETTVPKDAKATKKPATKAKTTAKDASAKKADSKPKTTTTDSSAKKKESKPKASKKDADKKKASDK